MSGVREVRRMALIDAIRDSGLSPAEFGERYLARTRSTVYRWLAGDSPVPSVVADWLYKYSHKTVRSNHESQG